MNNIVNNHFSLSSKELSKQYKVFLGSLHPSIQFYEIVYLLRKKGFDVELNREKSRTKKRFCVLNLTSPEQYQALLTDRHKVHFIRDHKIEVEMFLEGDLQIPKNEDLMKRKIYVGNLPRNISDQELQQFFSQYGSVKAAYVKNRKSKKTFRFGFVEFFNKNSASKIMELKKVPFNGKNVFIKEFKSKKSSTTGQGKSLNKLKLKNETQGSRSAKDKTAIFNFPQGMLQYFEIERDISPLRSILLKKIHERHMADPELLRFREH